MNERDARAKQAKLHELYEEVAWAEGRDRRARLFDFARREVGRAKRLVEEGLDKDRADERARGLDEAIVLVDALLEDEGERPGGNDYGRKRGRSLLRDYRRLLDLRRDLYRSVPGDDPPGSDLYLERISHFLQGLVGRFGDYRDGRWGPCENLRALHERRKRLEDELEEAGVSVSAMAAFKAYARHMKEHEPEKYAAIPGLAGIVEENGTQHHA